MAYNDNNVTMEDVRIIFRNFGGIEGTYNRAGDRNFAVLLNDDVAKAMDEDGWNVKWLKPREEGDEPQAYLPVSVHFSKKKNVKPPRIVMITHNGRNVLKEDTVEVLDWVDIAMVDLIVRPYEWEVNGKTGTKAYLQSIFVTIREDELELKYAEDGPNE